MNQFLHVWRVAVDYRTPCVTQVLNYLNSYEFVFINGSGSYHFIKTCHNLCHPFANLYFTLKSMEFYDLILSKLTVGLYIKLGTLGNHHYFTYPTFHQKLESVRQVSSQRLLSRQNLASLLDQLLYLASGVNYLENENQCYLLVKFLLVSLICDLPFLSIRDKGFVPLKTSDNSLIRSFASIL